MNDLPFEIYELILRFADVQSILRLEQTSSFNRKRISHYGFGLVRVSNLTAKEHIKKVTLYSDKNRCGLCLMQTDVINIPEWRLNVCTCIINNVISQDQLEYEPKAIDWKCVYSDGNHYMPKIFYLKNQVTCTINNEIQVCRANYLASVCKEVNITLNELTDKPYADLRKEVNEFRFRKSAISDEEAFSLQTELFSASLNIQVSLRKQLITSRIGNNRISPCAQRFIETGLISSSHLNEYFCSMGIISSRLTVDFKLTFRKESTLPDDIEGLIRHSLNEANIIAYIREKLKISVEKYYPDSHQLSSVLNQLLSRIQQHDKNSISSQILDNEISQAAEKFIATQKELQDHRTLFRQTSLELLQNGMINRCPLISRHILPFSKLAHSFQEIIHNYCNPEHQGCPKHTTICLEWAVSELACEYRAQECRKYLLNTLTEYIPNFHFSQLQGESSITRFSNSSQLGNSSTDPGMWLHVKENAQRIIRAEAIERLLMSKLGSVLSLQPQSQQIFNQYVIEGISPVSKRNGHDPDSVLMVVDREWPITPIMQQVLMEIEIHEARAADRRLLATNIIFDLNLYEHYLDNDRELNEIVNTWIASSQSQTELRESLTILHREWYALWWNAQAQKQLLKCTGFLKLFMAASDAKEFSKSETFRILSSSQLAVAKRKGNAKYVEAVLETITNYIENRIDRAIVQVVGRLLDYS